MCHIVGGRKLLYATGCRPKPLEVHVFQLPEFHHTPLNSDERSTNQDAEKGELIPFGRKLLYATGCRPKPIEVPGAELRNVVYCRYLSQSQYVSQHNIRQSRYESAQYKPVNL